MVYKSQLPMDYKRGDISRGQSAWVKKVISIDPNKIVLSIKDVDQTTGKDIMPHRNQAAMEAVAINTLTANKCALSSTAVVHPGLDVAALKQQTTVRCSTKQPLSEQELFEAQQLMRSGVLPVEQYPTYDPELGMLAIKETEEETEVGLAESEPAFLRGQTQKSGRRNDHLLEPIKIVKNPDGSLQRAMQQASMAKERRELRSAQSNQLIDSIPKDLNRWWEDPLPEAGE